MTRTFQLTLSFVLIMVGLVSARTYRLPAGEPIGMVRTPDKWKTKPGGEFIETVSADGQAHVLVVAVEERKVAEAVGEVLRHIRRTAAVVINARSVRKDSAIVNNKHLETVSWDGTHTGQPIKIRCYPVPAKKGRSLLVVFWGSVDSEKKHQRDIEKILQSIGPP